MILNGSLILHKPVRSLNKSPAPRGSNTWAHANSDSAAIQAWNQELQKKPQQRLVPLLLLVAQAEPKGERLSLTYRSVCAYPCLVLYHSDCDPGLTWDLLHHYGLVWWSGLLAGHCLMDHLFFFIHYWDIVTLLVNPLLLPVLLWFSAPTLHFLMEQQSFPCLWLLLLLHLF